MPAKSVPTNQNHALTKPTWELGWRGRLWIRSLTTTKLQLLMKKKTRVIIEHGDERYEVKFDRDCTRTCSFIKHTPYGPCENNCSLPKWFEKIVQKFSESHLKRITQS